MNNESEIAARLQPVQTPLQETVAAIEPLELLEQEYLHNSLPLDNMVLRRTTMEMLGVPTMQMMSSEIQDKTNYVLRWALESSQSNEMADILDVLSRQTRMMGIAMKEDRLERLYRYAKLNNQRKALEIQMRGLNG